MQLFLLIKQVRLSWLQIENQITWNKRNATFNYVDRYSKELRDMNSGIMNKLGLLIRNGTPLEIEELKEMLKDDKIRADILHIVTYFEHLAIGIREDYFDGSIAYKSFKILAITTHNALSPYFKQRKKELGHPIATNFNRLVEKWKSEILK